MTVPNWRNATGTQSPSLMTSHDGTHQIGVQVDVDYTTTVFKRVFGGPTTTYDLSADTTAQSNGIVPLYAVEDVNASHYAYACAIDDQNRTYIAGNSQGGNVSGPTTPHLIRSAPNSISSWTSLPWPFPGFPTTTGDNRGTYNLFNRLSTGELLFQIDQREIGSPYGKDNLGFILPIGANTFQPLVGVGEFVTSEPTTPNVIYVSGCYVEKTPHNPHNDRVWYWGVWRQSFEDATSQHPPWMIYNDTVTDPNTWKCVDGTAQPMPMTWANSTAAQVPQTHGTYTYSSGQIIVDRAGHPHIILKEGAILNQWHVWWDGATWQSQQANTSSTAPSLACLANGNMVMYRQFGGRIRLTSILAGGHSSDCGNYVPSVVNQAYSIPFADPIQLSQGRIHLLIADADDNPEVCTIGEHHRCVAS
jgi:hypothetical protein